MADPNHTAFLSHSYFSVTGHKPVASVFHPVYDDNNFIGIMGTDINFENLQNLVDKFLGSSNLYAFVTKLLKTIGELINNIVNSSSETEGSFNSILKMAENLNQRNSRVQTAMDNQNQGSKEILSSLNSITSITDSVQSGASEIAENSQTVLNEIINLKEVTKQSSIQIIEILNPTHLSLEFKCYPSSITEHTY